MKLSKLPDFIMCGFQKAGTTGAAYMLNEHPEITIAKTTVPMGWNLTSEGGSDLSVRKEFDFFICPETGKSSWTRGMEWYKSHFKQDGNMWGYCNPNYGMLWSCEWSANKMREKLGDIKLIFSVRNPIYREYSAYNHANQALLKHGKKWNDWPEDKEYVEILKTGGEWFYVNYIHVLKTYEKLFGKDNIHVMIHERMKSNDYQDEYNKLFDFLNVERTPIKFATHHARTYDRELSVDEKDLLVKRYSSEVNELFDWLGYKISEWPEFI